MSCAKGGTSVMADACLSHGWLSPQESRFSFEWGVLLQLGDDLQDVRQDLARGSVTLFSRAAAIGTPLDSLVMQLLRFSERVGAQMEDLPNGNEMLRELLRMSWRSLDHWSDCGIARIFYAAISCRKRSVVRRFATDFCAPATRNSRVARDSIPNCSTHSWKCPTMARANSLCRYIDACPGSNQKQFWRKGRDTGSSALAQPSLN